MILKEANSIQDVETYLRSFELIQDLQDEFGQTFYDEIHNADVVNYIEDQIMDRFDIYNSVLSDEVAICYVNEDQNDLVSSRHEVIEYNGMYYDYSALSFQNQFDNLTSISQLPVVQPVIHSENQVSPYISSVKHYCIMGY